MKNINLVKKKISKEYQTVSVTDPSKLLAEFFNGVIIKIDEEYIYES
tara:strand:+ start:142 stop:282 length:141 start_codon:yes stop_codon:yes gene_type:complete